MEMEGQKFGYWTRKKEIRLFITSLSFAFTLHQWVAETTCFVLQSDNLSSRCVPELKTWRIIIITSAGRKSLHHWLFGGWFLGRVVGFLVGFLVGRLVSLSVGLINYWTDFNKTWMDDGSQPTMDPILVQIQMKRKMEEFFTLVVGFFWGGWSRFVAWLGRERWSTEC